MVGGRDRRRGVGVLMSVAVVRERVDEIVLRRDPVFTD
jgi:hypothetical protein